MGGKLVIQNITIFEAEENLYIKTKEKKIKDIFAYLLKRWEWYV